MDKEQLKREHVGHLAGIRAVANSTAVTPELRRAGSLACAAIETTWHQVDAEQLWTTLPDEKDLTEGMRMGDHLAVTRMVLGLLA
jgi:hypothetical protein